MPTHKKKPDVSLRAVNRKKTKKTTKGFKSYPSCRYKLSLTDPHRYCWRCLGHKHDMTVCNSYLSLSKKSFLSRFIRYYLWSILPPIEGLPDKPPSSRVSPKTNSQAIIDVDSEEKFCEIVNKATDINKHYLQKFSSREIFFFDCSGFQLLLNRFLRVICPVITIGWLLAVLHEKLHLVMN